MPTHTHTGPWWAVLTVWGVVNAVNLLQAAGFLSRVWTNDMRVNHALGWPILALALPASASLFAFLRSGAGRMQTIGPALFLAFIVLMLVVDYLRPVEFRNPARPEILIPYLVLFFGAILLMGLPMFRLNRPLWLITAATTVVLLGSMAFAIRRGVG
jgi:hypothetical protein